MKGLRDRLKFTIGRFGGVLAFIIILLLIASAVAENEKIDSLSNRQSVKKIETFEKRTSKSESSTETDTPPSRPSDIDIAQLPPAKMFPPEETDKPERQNLSPIRTIYPDKNGVIDLSEVKPGETVRLPIESFTYTSNDGFGRTMAPMVECDLMNQDFEGDVTGWLAVDNDGDGNFWGIYTTEPHTGTYHAGIHWNTAGCDDWLLSPQIVMGSNNGRIKYWLKSYNASYLESYEFRVSTGSQTPASEANYPDLIHSDPAIPAIWTQYGEYDMNYSGSSIYLAWRCVSVDKYYLWLDDICFTAVPAVPTPPILYNSGGTAQLTFNNARINDDTPTFRVSSTHSSGSFDRFQVEINDAPDFTGTAYTQTFSGTYTNGTEYNLDCNSLSPALPTTDGITYYVRVRASADGGTSWSDWSTEGTTGAWSFTYNATGGANVEWFQTTDAQFETDTLSNTETYGSNQVRLKPSGTYTYDYSSGAGTDKWSYYCDMGNDASFVTTNFIQAGTESELGDYTTIEAPEETNYFEFDNSSSKTFRYEYIIDEDESNVSQIYALAKVMSEATVEHNFYIWNSTTSQWELLATSTSSGIWENMDGTITTNCADYIDAENKVHTCVFAMDFGGPAKWFREDYAKIEITTNITSGTIKSTPVRFASFDDAIDWGELTWSQTADPPGDFTVTVQKVDAGVWTDVAGLIDLDGSGCPHDISSLGTEDSIRLVGEFTYSAGAPELLDWTITANVSPPVDDAGITVIHEPICEGVDDILVTLKNYGTTTLSSCDIKWMVDDGGGYGTPTTYNWNGSIAPDGSESFIDVGDYTFASGTAYKIKAWTEDANGNGNPDNDDSNDTTEIVNVYTGLGGTYTIGGTDPDYNTFSDAVDALVDCGVKEAVIFNVRSGTYNEQIVIPEISGASATNTITFQSESGDSTDVTLTQSVNLFGSNYTIKLDGADYITFQKMTIQANGASYARVIELGNGANNNQFLNNQIFGNSSTSTSDYKALIYSDNVSTSIDNNNVFRNNWLRDGSYGFCYDGYNSSNRESGTIIENNTIESGFYGIKIQYNDNLTINNNYITHSSVSSNNNWGIYCNYCKDDFEMIGNEIVLTNTGNEVGIQLMVCDGNGTFGTIANNMVTVAGGTKSQGIYMNGTDDKYFYFNSFYSYGTNATGSKAFYMNGYSTADIRIKNNIFVSENGYAYYNSVGGITQSDYNDIWTNNGSYYAYWDGTACLDLVALQTESGMDVNSIELNPNFESATDLHINDFSNVCDAGIAIAEITDDIDGDSRGNPPDIGADEQGKLIYTVDDDLVENPDADFQVIQDALDQVYTDLGSNPFTVEVVVRVWTGTYTENPTPNSNLNPQPDARLVIEAARGQTPTIDGGNTAAVVTISNVDYVTLRGFKITGGTSYHGVVLDNGADCCNIENCYIYYNRYGIYTDITTAASTNLTIQNCCIHTNYIYGVWIRLGCNYPTVINNTIMQRQSDLGSTDANNEALWIDASNAVVRNNILYAEGSYTSGPSIYPSICLDAVAGNLDECDYNRFFYDNGARCAYDGAFRNTLGDWQASSGKDDNSTAGDPQCVDPLNPTYSNRDFHLFTQHGDGHSTANWPPSSNCDYLGTGSPDAEHSPCVDAGKPADSYDNEPTPNGSRINIGAYGNTCQASKSTPQIFVIDFSIGGNGYLAPGTANIPLTIYIHNYGADATNVSCTLSTTSADANVDNTNNPWGTFDLATGENADNSSAPYYVDILSSATDGQWIEFYVGIAGDNYYNRDTLKIRVNESKKEWTIMVYIGADNNLSAFVNSDIDEMETVGSDNNVHIITQIDGNASYGGYDDYLGNWATVRRYYVQSPNSVGGQIDQGFIEDLGELNSADTGVVVDFFEWGVNNFPANRYCFILWNHGGSWTLARLLSSDPPYKMIISDDTNGGQLSFAERTVEYIMRQAYIKAGKPIDILGFDACLVANLENEYEVLMYADHLVHSEESIPGNGYAYTFIDSFVNHPTYTNDTLATMMVQSYSGEYPTTDATLSNVRLDRSHIDLILAVDKFAVELIQAGGKTNADILAARTASQFNNSGYAFYDQDQIDLYEFADQIDARDIGGAGSELDLAAQAVKDAIGYPPHIDGRPLWYEWQYANPEAHGIMIYYPDDAPLSSPPYSDLRFCPNNTWKEFIYGEAQPSTKVLYNNMVYKFDEDVEIDSIPADTDFPFRIGARNSGTGTASGITATLATPDNRITIIDNFVSFPDIAAESNAISTDSFKINVSPSFPESTYAPFWVIFSTGDTSKMLVEIVGGCKPPDSLYNIAADPSEYCCEEPEFPCPVELLLTVEGGDGGTIKWYQNSLGDPDSLIGIGSPCDTTFGACGDPPCGPRRGGIEPPPYTFYARSESDNCGNSDPQSVEVWIPAGIPGDLTSISKVYPASTNPGPGGLVVLTASGGGPRGEIRWYDDICQGNHIATGETIYVNPTVTTTYYAIRWNPCGVSPGGCLNITVTVDPVGSGTVYNSQIGKLYTTIQDAIDVFAAQYDKYVLDGPQYVEIRDDATHTSGVRINTDPANDGVITTATNTLTLRAEEGRNPIVNAGNQNSLIITDVSYITIDGITFSGGATGASGGYQAIRINGISSKCEFITIQNCDIGPNDNMDGIYIRGSAGGSNITISDCEIHNTSGEHEQGIVVGDEGCTNLTVRDCKIYDNNTGIFIAGTGNNDYLTVERCLFATDSMGILINQAGSNNMTIENCLFYGNYEDDLQLYASSANTNITLKNNTSYNDASVNWANFTLSSNGATVSNITLKNNIIWQFDASANSYCIYVDANAQSGFVSDYNDLYTTNGASVGYWGGTDCATLNDWATATGQDANSISTDPLFVSTVLGSEDFHLKSSDIHGTCVGCSWPPTNIVGNTWQPDATYSNESPCIDAGEPCSNCNICDFRLEPYPHGCRINMGCYGGTPQASKSWDDSEAGKYREPPARMKKGKFFDCCGEERPYDTGQ